MNIVDVLKQYKGTFIKFVEYLASRKVDPKTIITANDLDSVMFWYLSFLESQHTYVIADHNGVVIYKMFDKQQYLIECVFSDKPLISKYTIGLIKAFEYLEKPF